MKYIVAIIQPHKLDEVMESLEDMEVKLVTVSNVLGRGRQKGLTEVYRGAKEVGSLLKKIKLEIACNEDFVEPTVQAIIKGARTGEIGGREDIHNGSSRGSSDPYRRTGRQGY